MSFTDGPDPRSVAPQGAAACAALAEALSALRDGEATPGEETRVREHVQECAACGQVLEEFAILDRSLRVHLPELVVAEADAFESSQAAAGSFARSPAMSSTPRRPFLARSSPWTRRVAAALLAAVAAGLLVVLPGPSADAARIARSVATVEVLQDRERSSQENLRRTLEWELRALRLEVGLLAPRGPAPVADLVGDPAASVRERIDRLLARVVELADAPPPGVR